MFAFLGATLPEEGSNTGRIVATRAKKEMGILVAFNSGCIGY